MTNEEYRLQAMDWVKEDVIHWTFIDKWYFDYLLDKTFLLIPLAIWFTVICIVLLGFYSKKIGLKLGSKFDIITSFWLPFILVGVPLVSLITNISPVETLYLTESQFFKNLPNYKQVILLDKLDSHFSKFLYKEKQTSPRLTQIELRKFKEIIFDVFPLEEDITSNSSLDSKEDVLRKLNYYRLENVRSSESDW